MKKSRNQITMVKRIVYIPTLAVKIAKILFLSHKMMNNMNTKTAGLKIRIQRLNDIRYYNERM